MRRKEGQEDVQQDGGAARFAEQGHGLGGKGAAEREPAFPAGPFRVRLQQFQERGGVHAEHHFVQGRARGEKGGGHGHAVNGMIQGARADESPCLTRKN
ncbi:MAG: hypothetical protein O3B24_10200 [Verrucomicrobia bacterium]|nr:hypothetical protein [Verrucomicrobiota bacterium]